MYIYICIYVHACVYIFMCGPMNDLAVSVVAPSDDGAVCHQHDRVVEPAAYLLHKHPAIVFTEII